MINVIERCSDESRSLRETESVGQDGEKVTYSGEISGFRLLLISGRC